MPSPRRPPIRREDYRPPEWLVPEISLDFELAPERTIVRATLDGRRATARTAAPLRLDGDGLSAGFGRMADGAAAKWRWTAATSLLDIAGDGQRSRSSPRSIRAPTPS